MNLKREERFEKKGEKDYRRNEDIFMIFLTHLNYFSVNEVPASADVKESAIRGGGGNGGEQGF